MNCHAERLEDLRLAARGVSLANCCCAPLIFIFFRVDYTRRAAYLSGQLARQREVHFEPLYHVYVVTRTE